MDLQLNDRTALVLSASKGIGKGIAHLLAKEKCKVIITSSNLENLKRAAQDIEMSTGQKVEYYVMDMGSAASVAMACDQILKDHGKVDILVTNSPGPQMTDAALLDIQKAQNALNILLLNVILVCNKFIPGMIQNKFGRIISLCSTTAAEPDAGMVLSNISRAAVVAYCKTLSREIAGHGITINTILTGGVQTDRTLELRKARSEKTGISFEELSAQAAKHYPVGFIPSPEEFAPAIIFLASPLSKDVNGVSLPIDGGYMRSL